MIDNRQLVGTFENIHLLRRLFMKRSCENSPLHFSQMAIMATIEKNENCTQATIAERLKVTPASVATSTKRLQKAGLITKTVDSDNLRCKRLALTDEGRTLVEEHMKIHTEYDELIFSCLSDDEKAQLLDYLERIIAKMQEIEGIDGDFSNPMDLSCLLRKRFEEIE